MSVQQTEFKNDNVQVIVSRSKGSRVKLEINVSPLATQAAYKQAIKAVGKEISRPGFRKGKAPDNYILQNYKGHVESEWNNILLNTSFQEALDLTKIYPFSKNNLFYLPQSRREENSRMVLVARFASRNFVLLEIRFKAKISTFFDLRAL